MKLILVPFSGAGLGHGNGANLAPEKIVEQLTDMFANENGEDVAFTTETINVDEEHFANSHKAIEDYMKTQQEKAIVIGGDHSITHPLVKGLSQRSVNDEQQNENIFTQGKFHFIVFDAHPDLMDDFRPPTQEDYLKVLIEEEIVKAEDVTLIGVRNWDKQEINYLKEKQIRCYTAKEIFEKGIKDVMQEIVASVNKPIYLSLDIDVVDPVEAIGTGYIEHGGLSSRELIYALQQLKKTGKISMVDFVEVNPNKDINDMTSKLAAKCIVELIGF